MNETASNVREQDMLTTLFDLGRQVTGVLDLDELLAQIPRLIGRLISFDAFAVYLLDERRGELKVAYSVGYPPGDQPMRLRLGEGLVGAAIASETPLLVNDVAADSRYVTVVPGMASELVVPLRHQARPIGALNVLSHRKDQFSSADAAVLRQFGAQIAVALVNARLFEQSRTDAAAFETLAEIGRDVAAVLDLDQLFARIAQLVPRVIAYRTFGILLLNEEQGELEMKYAVQYGEKVEVPRVRLGEGLVGYAALHKEAVLVSDVSQDPALHPARARRALRARDPDAAQGSVRRGLRSREPRARCLLQARHRNPDAPGRSGRSGDRERAAVRSRSRQRDQAGEGSSLRAARAVSAPAHRLAQAASWRRGGRKLPFGSRAGRDFHDFLSPESHTLVVAVGDVSGKGVPAALYSVFAAELVRGRTFRRRYLPERSTPASVLSSVNTILHQRQLEEYYCTLCYSVFDLKRRIVTLANSGLPYPVRASGTEVTQIELPGVPLGSFPGTTYDEVTFALHTGDLLRVLQ